MAEAYDIVVVGGGITGAGVARDAALRGARVALFEKGDFGSGTSSKSSKLIHGGLRYLEHGEIGLVFESVSERRVQCQVAPHLVRPLPFLLPIYRGSKVGLEKMNIGLWIYDTLAMFRSPRMHRTYRGRKARALEPRLKQAGFKGAIEYFDCYTDDARLVLENVLDAIANGALCKSYTEVIAIERKRREGRVSGVRIRDVLTGEEQTIGAHSVVLATGPWTDELAAPFDLGFERKLLRPTKGVHLVFPREKLPLDRAVTLFSPHDERVMFAIPWCGRTVLGTTDTDFSGHADDVHADAADARYLCDAANAYFPEAQFSPGDVIATWAGLRPLIHEDGQDASDVSREHQIDVRDDGVVIVAGGKLTTYRLMAKEIVRATLSWLVDNDSTLFEGRPLTRPRTKKRALPGGVGLDDASPEGVTRFARELAAKHGLAPATADHLASVYGSRASELASSIAANPALGEPLQADLPHVWAEVPFAVTRDLARTVDDVLARRVPLLLLGRDQGLDIVDRVADLVRDTLGWNSERRAAEIARYRGTVADSRRFRTE